MYEAQDSALYDHVAPPSVDQNGYGLRVPGIVVSPFARQGKVDHQTRSFDAYDKFIEADFLRGQRLDPRTDGLAPTPAPPSAKTSRSSATSPLTSTLPKRPANPCSCPCISRPP
jgi:phospholipase C